MAVSRWKGGLSATQRKAIADRKNRVQQIYKSDTMTASKNRYGWTSVRMFDAQAGIDSKGRWIEFKMRTKDFQYAFERKGRYDYNIDDTVRAVWRDNYSTGQAYTARRHVEGAFKVAMSKMRKARVQEDMDYWANEAMKWGDLLEMDNNTIKKYWDEWTAARSNAEIKEYMETDSPKLWQGFEEAD